MTSKLHNLPLILPQAFLLFNSVPSLCLDASSEDIDNGQARIEAVNHRCGVEEVGIPSACQ